MLLTHITPGQELQIENIILYMEAHDMKCVKDYQCYKSDLHTICKVKRMDPFDDIQCDNPDANCCSLSFVALTKGAPSFLGTLFYYIFPNITI